MDYYFFLDESGDHGLSFIDEKFPVFLLAGCLFEETEYLKVQKEISDFKKEFFKTIDVILHSREIRKCEGSFQILFNLELKKRFYHQLNLIIGTSNFRIIAVAINKKNHIERYGKSAGDPYSICLAYILERLIYCTDEISASSKISITIEKRGKNEDEKLVAHYNRIIDRGTFHVDSVRFKKRIIHLEMNDKRDNNVGLQVADLCAYPIARHVLNAGEPYIPFKIIEDKFYKSKKGIVKGFGLKVFP